jgi:hypothetical protein
VSTFQSKRCGHCGRSYAYQTSGYGGIQDHNSPTHCQPCAEVVEKAVRDALERVPVIFDVEWRPTRDVTVEELERVEQERMAEARAEGHFPVRQVLAPLFDLERPGNVQHQGLVHLDGRTYRYEWWSDHGRERGVVYLECKVELATGEVVGPWSVTDHWKTPPTFYEPEPLPELPPTHEHVPMPLAFLRQPTYPIVESCSLDDFGLGNRAGMTREATDAVFRMSSEQLGEAALDAARPKKCCCARCAKYDGCPNPAQNEDGFCLDCASGGPHRGFDEPLDMLVEPGGSYLSIERLVGLIDDPNRSGCLRMLKDNRELFDLVPGSVHNHQAWEGGYLDHVREVMNIAYVLYGALASKRPLPFTLSSALLVLYLHDVEKPWKYQPRAEGGIEEIPAMRGDKAAQHAFREAKLGRYGLSLTPVEAEAFKYVEGERDADYSNRRRVMNELAGFCHACDVLSARLWHDYPREGNDPWPGASR